MAAGGSIVRGRRALLAHIVLPAVLSGCDRVVAPEPGSCAPLPLDPGVALHTGFNPRTQVSLAPGAMCALGAEAAYAFAVPGAGVPVRYLVAVLSADETPGATARLALHVRGPAGGGERASAVGVPRSDAAHAGPGRDAELIFRRNARRALRGVPPYRPDPRRLRRNVVAAPPAPGDTVVFRNSVGPGLDVSCDRRDSIVAVARAVGSHFAIAEDVRAAGHLTSARYGEMLQVLDEIVFPVDTAYFGPAADLDGNGRVWTLLTPVVNRLSPRGGETYIAGFFNPTDLSAADSCPASNQGEVLYVLAPDPDGAFGDEVSAEFAARNAIGVTAHELAHLLVADARIVFGRGTFADLEEPWLSEGLAHIAETVVGWKAAGLGPREEHGFAELHASPDVFATFHRSNFRRTGYYFLASNRTPALGSSGGADPGGIESLRMRGFAWLLLRWLADHAAVGGVGILGGPAEERLFRDLASGGAGLAAGIENVERVARGFLGVADWAGLLERYGLAPLADDVVEGGAGIARVRSFALRDVFRGLHQSHPETLPFTVPYPLLVTEVGLESSTAMAIAFDLAASTARYFELSSEIAHPRIHLGLEAENGGPVPGSVRPRVLVMRAN